MLIKRGRSKVRKRMKDFRETYRHSDHEGKYFPNQKTFEHGGSTGANFGGFLKNLFFLGVIIAAIVFYFNSSNEEATPEVESATIEKEDFPANIETWLDSKLSMLDILFNELELSLNESSSYEEDTDLSDSIDSSSIPSGEDVQTYGNIIEYSLVPSGKDIKVFGIIENVSSKVLGPMKVSVTLDRDPTKFYTGNSLNAFTPPGENVPFEIRVTGWDGIGEILFYADGDEFYNKKIQDVNVSFDKGSWDKTKYTMKYNTNFINKTNSIISFPQMIIVMRNKEGSILGIERKYLASEIDKYKIPALKSFPVELNVYFVKEIPNSTDVYFSYLPL